jgi:hypothetical protein
MYSLILCIYLGGGSLMVQAFQPEGFLKVYQKLQANSFTPLGGVYH